MAFSEKLAGRVRRVLRDRADVTEKKMFGGVAFLVRGKMACGLQGDSLIVRIGRDAAKAAVARPHIKPMDFTGKVLSTFATIEAEGVKTEAQLRRWVLMAIAYAESQPPRGRSRRRPG
jgi:TfoX/Sxy family transcriptional regulator of competence genes